MPPNLSETANPEKMTVALALLQERYNASHRIRERSDRYLLLGAGWAAAVLWYAVQCTQGIGTTQKLLAAFATLCMGTLMLLLQCALFRGFRNNHRAISRLEQAVGAYARSAGDAAAAHLPREYRMAPYRRPRWSDHFCIVLVWTAVMTVIVIVALFLAPATGRRTTRSACTSRRTGIMDSNTQAGDTIDTAIVNPKEGSNGKLP